MLAGEIYSAVDPQLIPAASVGEGEGKEDPKRSLGTYRRR